jgi:hypothetical protein
LRRSPLRRGPWPSRGARSVAPGSARGCSAPPGAARHARAPCASRRCVAHLGRLTERRASRLGQLRAARRSPAAARSAYRSVAPCAAPRCVAALDRLAARGASRLVQLGAARRPAAASRHARALRIPPLSRGSWPSRGARRVASGAAQSCSPARSRLALLHLGASRRASASRPLTVSRRAERRAWCSSELTGGPQPPRATSDHRAVRRSPLRRGSWPSRGARRVAPGAAQSSRRLAQHYLRSHHISSRGRSQRIVYSRRVRNFYQVSTEVLPRCAILKGPTTQALCGELPNQPTLWFTCTISFICGHITVGHRFPSEQRS